MNLPHGIVLTWLFRNCGFSLLSFLKVWKVAVGGSSLIMALMIVFGILWGLCFGILPRQSAFVAACLSLSSTPLVAKFVESKDDDHYAKGKSKTILLVS